MEKVSVWEQACVFFCFIFLDSRSPNLFMVVMYYRGPEQVQCQV